MKPPSFPNNIRALRLRYRITQSQLARRAGISLRTLWSIETGQRNCRMDTKKKILAALNIPFEDRETAFPTTEGN